jgi:hypothetical protein
MLRLLSSLLLTGLLVLPAEGQVAREPATPVVRVLVPTSLPPPKRALQYALLPEEIELVPGNAAMQWLRASQAAADTARKMTLEEHNWGTTQVPLDALPRDKVCRLLQTNRFARKLADRAACYDHCDWEYPPLTIQDMGLILPDIQQIRTLASLLSIRCRLELAEGRFDNAAYTLQTGMATGCHLANTTVLVQSLVGMTIINIMDALVEDWLTLPGAPDLYWPLTALPNPIVASGRALRTQSGMLYRSLPQLRHLGERALTVQEASQIATEVLRTLAPLAYDRPPPSWQARLGLTALTAQAYPQARQHLLARGRAAEQVDAMPTLQVVWIYFMDQYDETWDDVLKLLSLPYWQARPGLEK